MSPLTTKAQILKFKSNILRSIARRYKKSRKTQEGHLEEGKPQKPTKGTKSGKSKKKWQERIKKISKSTQKLKRARKCQN
jgi:hypothetical protein